MVAVVIWRHGVNKPAKRAGLWRLHGAGPDQSASPGRIQGRHLRMRTAWVTVLPVAEANVLSLTELSNCFVKLTGLYCYKSVSGHTNWKQQTPCSQYITVPATVTYIILYYYSYLFF